jgi:hypothetical protein
MGLDNINRLKKKFGFTEKDKGVNKYFLLIDLVFYEGKIFCEEFIFEDLVSWSFEDESLVILDYIEIANLLLFLEGLSNDVNEQLLNGFVPSHLKKCSKLF